MRNTQKILCYFNYRFIICIEFGFEANLSTECSFPPEHVNV